MARIPVFTIPIRRWLKAGVVELGHYTDTETGTPQGGVISPLLANIALDGLERLFGSETPDGHLVRPSVRKGLNRGISLIRYADDFVVTAPSREILETYVVPRLSQFLAERGLTLSHAKTRIVHREEGFHFLGFTIRYHKGKLLTKPQKEKVHRHLRHLKAILDANKQATIEQIVRKLNPVIWGWANYYRHGVSKRTFNYVQHRLLQMLWRWAKRRHSNKSTRWIQQRYYKSVGNRNWVFGDANVTLRNPADMPIVRHIKVRGRSSPYDPALHDYWAKRSQRRVEQQANSWRKRNVLRRQECRCGQCSLLFQPEDNIHYHHCIPRHQGGSDRASNRVAIHPHCHHQFHQRHGYKVLKA